MVALLYACCAPHNHFNVLFLLQTNLFSADHLSLVFMISSYFLSSALLTLQLQNTILTYPLKFTVLCCSNNDRTQMEL